MVGVRLPNTHAKRWSLFDIRVITVAMDGCTVIALMVVRVPSAQMQMRTRRMIAEFIQTDTGVRMGQRLPQHDQWNQQ